ncbi:MAG: phosphoglycerate kinase [Clostridiales bacterium]|nr:phosphoglycerate kinase [Clostridiales bacterium]
MKEFPRTEVAGISLPRMIIGTNWMLGYSHRTASADDMIRARYSTKEAVCETLCAYLKYGIDAMMAPFVDNECQPKQVLMDGIHMAEEKMGRKIILIDTPSIDVSDTEEGRANARRKIEAVAKNGATFCLIHHASAEQLVCKRTATIDRLQDYTKIIREYGMIPGLSAHMPELIIYSDAHPEYDVQTYIQIYNCMGFLMQVEIENVRRIIENAKKPVMTIKSMAAGRCTPYVGITFSYASLRPQDMVTIGAHTPREVHEDVEIALAAIERRYPNMEKRNSPQQTKILGGNQ